MAFFVFMRAEPIKTSREVAVMAEHPISGGEIPLNYESIKRCGPIRSRINSLAMSSPGAQSGGSPKGSDSDEKITPGGSSPP